MSMQRLAFDTLSPEPYKALLGVKKALDKSSLGQPLIELINLRVSQINGCAFCLDMHSKSLRAGGEEQARLDSLAGWKVSELYSERERAALAWAESLTHVAETNAPDAVYEPLKAHFSDPEISDLTIVISLMNALNRMAVGLRK